jgi:hypothetical protein
MGIWLVALVRLIVIKQSEYCERGCIEPRQRVVVTFAEDFRR